MRGGGGPKESDNNPFGANEMSRASVTVDADATPLNKSILTKTTIGTRWCSPPPLLYMLIYVSKRVGENC